MVKKYLEKHNILCMICTAVCISSIYNRRGNC